MISAISNAGTMRFMLYQEKMTVGVFLKFLERLIRGQKRKLFLIVDNLKVHHAIKVQEWTKNHEKQIELFFLPPYAPDLNPDELLNQDVQANACHNRLSHNTQQLKSDLLSYLRSVQKKPKKIQNFFQKASVLYAA